MEKITRCAAIAHTVMAQPTSSLALKIEDFRTADNEYRQVCNLDHDSGHDEAWNAKEDAEQRVIEHPCTSLEDIHAKVKLALEDENVFDSIQNCTFQGEDILRIFLRSLMPSIRSGGVA